MPSRESAKPTREMFNGKQAGAEPSSNGREPAGKSQEKAMPEFGRRSIRNVGHKYERGDKRPNVAGLFRPGYAARSCRGSPQGSRTTGSLRRHGHRQVRAVVAGVLERSGHPADLAHPSGQPRQAPPDLLIGQRRRVVGHAIEATISRSWRPCGVRKPANSSPRPRRRWTNDALGWRREAARFRMSPCALRRFRDDQYARAYSYLTNGAISVLRSAETDAVMPRVGAPSRAAPRRAALY
jgi:hypothetical protein